MDQRPLGLGPRVIDGWRLGGPVKARPSCFDHAAPMPIGAFQARGVDEVT